MKKEESKKEINIINKAKNSHNEFREFLTGYNVVQLAIGVVIGSAVKDLVTSMANNLLMPMVGIFTPSGSWRNISFEILNSKFQVGLFLGSLLDFIIVALVVFVVIKKILRIEINKK